MKNMDKELLVMSGGAALALLLVSLLVYAILESVEPKESGIRSTYIGEGVTVKLDPVTSTCIIVTKSGFGGSAEVVDTSVCVLHGLTLQRGIK